MALINGTAGDDFLVDSSGSDTINGFEGDDWITVSGGSDVVAGGAGSDRLVIDYAASGGNITSTFPSANGSGHSGSFANGGSSVSYSGIDHFTVLSGAGNDDLRTGSGDDVFQSGAGNDIIRAGSGAVSADGGSGNDGLAADLSALGDSLAIDLQANTSSGSAALSVLNIEFLSDGNTGFFLTGSGNDTIVTRAAAFRDNLNTGAGNDTVVVAGGIDNVQMGTGDDRLVIDYSGTSGNINSTTPLSDANGHHGSITNGFDSQVMYTGVEHFTVTLNSGHDILRTGNGQDVIRSGSGNDTVAAGGGDDLVAGGAGNDSLDGGAGNDTAVVAGTAANLIATQVGSNLVLNREGIDTLANFEWIEFAGLTPSGDNRVQVVAGDAIVEARNDAASVGETGSVGGNVLANDLDLDDAMSVAAGTLGGGYGVLALSANGTYSYGANANFLKAGETVQDVFVYTVTAGGVSVSAELAITLTGENDLPSLAGITLGPIAEDSAPLLITQADLLAGASDVDGDALAATGLAIAAGGGLLVDNGDGTWTYAPAADDDSSVSFSFNVTDGTASLANTATLDLAPVNDAPAVTPVVLAPLAEDGGRVLTQAELLAGAADADGDDLVARGLAIASGGGTLVDNGDGTWSYTAAPDDDSSVSFAFDVDDGTARVANTATLDISPANDAPAVTPIVLAAIAEDSGARLITQAQLLEGALDADGPALAATGLAIAAGGGTLVDNGDGTWSYTAAANDDSGVSFTFEVSDGHASVANSATLDITPVNDAPNVAGVDLGAIAEDSGRLITQAQLLSGATDVDGAALVASGLAIASGGGSLVSNGDGTWTYTAAADDASGVSFTFTVSDGMAAVANTATLDLTPVNDAPLAVADAVGVNEDATTGNLWSALLANDTDADAGDTRTIVSVDTAGTLGSVQFDAASGELRYVADAAAFDALDPGQSATDTFHYTVQDASGATSTAQVTMTIAGVANDGSSAKLILGTARGNLLRGSRGDDDIRGLGGNDTLLGGKGGDDVLSGGAGKDLLLGEKGNDTLDGGAGRDKLLGGKGDDTFVLRKGEAHGDVILDFEAWSRRENDTLVLEGYGDDAFLVRRGWDYTVYYDGGRETFTVVDARLDAGDVMFT